MAIGLGVLVGSLVGGVGKLLTVEVAKAVAFRALLYTALTLILPAVLYNLFSLIVSETLDYISSYAGNQGITGAVVQLAGLGAWLAARLKVVESLSFVLGCVSVRFVISMIRGV